MKIVICATTFPPALGGLENVAEMTADALGRGGDAVTVLTRTAGPEMPERAYRLVRSPSFFSALRECRTADAAVMVNVGLKILSPLLASRTPFAIWHQTLHIGAHADRRTTLPDRIKDQVVRRLATRNLGCSDYVTATLPGSRTKSTVANPYDPARMFEEPGVTRDGDLVFVGRLVSDKGVDVILRAMALPPLAFARLTIVGQGPERSSLGALAAELGLADRVRFVGARTGAELRRTFAAHRVLVVPSVWEEPFGIVALEGLACGCEVVVARSGGLPE
ncbi:MAG: glycosyltransferase, partial [Sphingomonadales bacterium]